PTEIATDKIGNLFIVERGQAAGFEERVRKVDAQTGIITTVAGMISSTNGCLNFDPFKRDGERATNIALCGVVSPIIDKEGNIFISDGPVISRIDGKTGLIKTLAIKDPEQEKNLLSVNPAAFDLKNNLLVSTIYSLREVDPSSSSVTRTIAGNNQFNFRGDGLPANQTSILAIKKIASDNQGNIFIGDTFNGWIRKQDVNTGKVTIVAGKGIENSFPIEGKTTDPNPATAKDISLNPSSIFALDRENNLFINDLGYIRRVDAQTGMVSTVAGNGKLTISGDGDLAILASIGFVSDLAIDATGNLFIFGDRGLRRVDAQTGIINTIVKQRVGKPTSGDNGPAIDAGFTLLIGFALDANGNIF
ncbi:MAG: adhesin/invasin, partial [bacterium]